MLARLEDERRESGRRMLAAQEAERRRVARELHDQVGQTLTGLMLTIGQTAKRAPEVRQELTEAQEAARQLSADVNDLVKRLRPEALDDLGLTSALTVLGEQFSDMSSVELVREFEWGLPVLDRDVEVVLYRVAQESLTNVARHADAASARLRLISAGDRVVLEIADDGHGLNGGGQGNGIRGMRERAVLVGGELDIHSSRNGGVTVRLEVPAGEAA
jgi:two-component system sensor histidine kinase UhpB